MHNIPSYWQENIVTSTLTSMKIGGLARYFARVTTQEQLDETLRVAHKHNLPIGIIGGGSNTVFADEGFEGVLIQLAFNEREILSTYENSEAVEAWRTHTLVQDRYTAQKSTEFLQLAAPDISEEGETVYVKCGAGVAWGQAVMWSLQNNLAGLQWYARIPCHVGGAVVNNIHGERHFFSEVIVAVHAVHKIEGTQRIFTHTDLQFGYDASIFRHDHNWIITHVVCALTRVEPDVALQHRNHYLDWTKEKTRIQPSGANCGSVFQNIEPSLAPVENMVAAGWYVDQVGLKGAVQGDLQVYPGHANFINNRAKATQADLIALITRIRSAVHEKFNIWLQPEVECMNVVGEYLIWEESETPRWQHV